MYVHSKGIHFYVTILEPQNVPLWQQQHKHKHPMDTQKYINTPEYTKIYLYALVFSSNVVKNWDSSVVAKSAAQQKLASDSEKESATQRTGRVFVVA